MIKRILLATLLISIILVSGCSEKEIEYNFSITCEEFGGVCKSECNETEGYLRNPTECETCCVPLECPECDFFSGDYLN